VSACLIVSQTRLTDGRRLSGLLSPSVKQALLRVGGWEASLIVSQTRLTEGRRLSGQASANVNEILYLPQLVKINKINYVFYSFIKRYKR